jgi:hypothetical protein
VLAAAIEVRKFASRDRLFDSVALTDGSMRYPFFHARRSDRRVKDCKRADTWLCLDLETSKHPPSVLRILSCERYKPWYRRLGRCWRWYLTINSVMKEGQESVGSGWDPQIRSAFHPCANSRS